MIPVGPVASSQRLQLHCELFLARFDGRSAAGEAPFDASDVSSGRAVAEAVVNECLSSASAAAG